MSSQAAIPELKKLVENLDADEIVRAHAVIALGKLGDKGSVRWLVKDGLTDKSTHVQRSSAIALGLLTDKEDDKTVETMMTLAKSAADRAVRNFCLIALGQIGNMKGRDFLVTAAQEGPAARPDVLGARARRLRQPVQGEPDRARQRASDAWKETKSDSERGAFAIGMGLLDYKAGAASDDGRAEDRRIARPEGPRRDGARSHRREGRDPDDPGAREEGRTTSIRSVGPRSPSASSATRMRSKVLTR